MANIKSAKKRILVSRRQNLRNRMIKSAVKTGLKKAYAAAETGDAAKTRAAYRAAVSLVDKACLKGVMHKNAAAHKKAQLARLVAAK